MAQVTQRLSDMARGSWDARKRQSANRYLRSPASAQEPEASALMRELAALDEVILRRSHAFPEASALVRSIGDVVPVAPLRRCEDNGGGSHGMTRARATAITPIARGLLAESGAAALHAAAQRIGPAPSRLPLPLTTTAGCEETSTLPAVDAQCFRSVRHVGPAAAIGPQECAICLASFSGCDKLRLIPCGSPTPHVFHELCAIKWFRKRVTCPVCRADVSRSGIPMDRCRIPAPPPSETSHRIGTPLTERTAT